MNPYVMDLLNIIRSYGRGVVFYADRWDPGMGVPLNLTHLGDTEGDITFNPNATVEALTAPEISGGAPLELDYTGEAPVLEVPLFLADPALLAVISPLGNASAGHTIRQAVRERTFVVFPEQLFVLPNEDGIAVRRALSFAGGVWTLNGSALPASHVTLSALAIWLWRCGVQRPPRVFRGGAGDARKNIATGSITVMDHPDMPDGHRLYTQGDPAAAGIDLLGGS